MFGNVGRVVISACRSHAQMMGLAAMSPRALAATSAALVRALIMARS
jgi:hypothetical protein